VPYNTVNDFFQNIQYQLDGVPEAVLIQAFITAQMIANPSWALSPLNQGDRNDILKRLTGCTAATQTTLNCYPRGLVTTLCFDTEGNPIP
jgi:hypothetical protein